jgi:hypothetical protein
MKTLSGLTVIHNVNPSQMTATTIKRMRQEMEKMATRVSESLPGVCDIEFIEQLNYTVINNT